MKKFQVENAYRTAEMIATGEYTNITMDHIGDYIEAETAEEAIEIAMDYIMDEIHANSYYRAEIEGGSVLVYDDDAIIEEYCRFTAKEKETEDIK